MPDWQPEPITIGDRVEVPAKSGMSMGTVTAVEIIDRPYKTPNGYITKPAPCYTVKLDCGKTVKTQSVSYSPGAEVITALAAAIREGCPTRYDKPSDFTGFDGPGIRETRLVVGPKGSNRGV